jgi:hypothetical protein
MKREEFIAQTVAATMSRYLDLYRPPHTTVDAQERCIADAERLADRVFGVLEAPAEGVSERPRIAPQPRGIIRRMR